MLLTFALGREKKPKKYYVKCNECGKLLNKTSMKKHILTHKDKSEWPWSCALCKKRTQTQHDLIKHLRSKVHENDRVPMEGTEKWYQLINHDRMGGYVHLPKKKRSFSTEQSNIEDDLKDSILNALYSNIPKVCETEETEKKYSSDTADNSSHDSTNKSEDAKHEQEQVDYFEEENICNDEHSNIFDCENIEIFKFEHERSNKHESKNESIGEFSKPLDLSTSSISGFKSESSSSLSSSESLPMPKSLPSLDFPPLPESQLLSESEKDIASSPTESLDDIKGKTSLQSESSEYLDENENNLEPRMASPKSPSCSSAKGRKLQVRITKLEIDPVIIEFIRENHYSRKDHVSSSDFEEDMFFHNQKENSFDSEIKKTYDSENKKLYHKNSDISQQEISENSELDISYNYMEENSCQYKEQFSCKQEIPFNSMHFSYNL